MDDEIANPMRHERARNNQPERMKGKTDGLHWGEESSQDPPNLCRKDVIL
jgi:hypothetical protein